MDENVVWRMVRQILEALAYIHSQKIIHRDLVGSPVRVHCVVGNVALYSQCHLDRNRAISFSILKGTSGWVTLDLLQHTE